MAKKDPERRAKTRKRIMDAYISLLDGGGSARITASSVIEKAGVNRSTFYVYFTDIEDVYGSIEDELIEDMRQVAEEAIATTDDLDIISLVSQTYREYGKLLGLLMQSPTHPTFIERVKKQLKPVVEKRLAETIDVEMAPYVSEFVAGGLLSLYSSWFNKEDGMTLDDLAPIARSLVFSCIG